VTPGRPGAIRRRETAFSPSSDRPPGIGGNESDPRLSLDSMKERVPLFEHDLGSFGERLGLEIVEATSDLVVLALKIHPELWQPDKIVHGGVYCAVVEGAASLAATLWLGNRGRVVGVSNHTDFLHAVHQGRLVATATPIHRGRLQQLWLVDIRNEQDRTVARGQVRLQNLPSHNSECVAVRGS
jgi:1,4-dihydroxy-2-naphthoyl-CoA hydrolase